jgi:hypothetical protein
VDICAGEAGPLRYILQIEISYPVELQPARGTFVQNVLAVGTDVVSVVTERDWLRHAVIAERAEQALQ